MDCIDKIYKFSNGVLHEVKVEKTTRKQVFIPRCQCFFYAKTLAKNFVCTTPAEALQEAKNRALSRIGSLSDRLAAEEAKLKAVNEYEKKYT